MKPFATLAAVIFIGALVFAGPGCRSPRTSAPAQAVAPPSSGELNPIQAWNRYLRLLAEGDQDAIRASVYAHPDSSEPILENSIAVYHSVAGLHQAFDQAYGTNSLTRLGFRCLTLQSRLPS
jgi:hypothetical protein